MLIDIPAYDSLVLYVNEFPDYNADRRTVRHDNAQRPVLPKRNVPRH